MSAIFLYVHETISGRPTLCVSRISGIRKERERERQRDENGLENWFNAIAMQHTWK